MEPHFTTPEPKLETYTADLSNVKLTLNKWFGWLGVCRGEKRKLEQRTEQYNAAHAAWVDAREQYKVDREKYYSDQSSYVGRRNEYETWRAQLEVAEKRGAALNEALKTNAERRREALSDGVEAKEAAYREEAYIGIRVLRRLEQLDHTMDSIFAPRPREVNPVVAEKKGSGVSLDRKEFAQIVAHGYDLPENCKLTPREAAVVNLTLAGAPSITQPVFDKLHPFLNPIEARLKPIYGYNMIVTGLFGTARDGQEWEGVHAAFDAAKESIQDYQDGKPEKLGGYLGEGLRNLVTGCDSPVSGLDKTSVGLVTKRILEVLDNHPDLMAHSGLSEKELRDARGSVALSEISRNAMKAKLLLQQADAGLRELSPGEKGRCLADLTLLKLSEQAVETERAACEDTPDYRAALAKAEQDTAVAMQKREDFIKNHQEEIRENYKKLYPDRNNGDFETQYDLLYGAPGNIITSFYQIPVSNFQNELGCKGALEAVQNRYRNDSLLQNAAAEKTPKEILGMVSNPIKLGKELGKLEAQRKREKKNPVKAPVQANQKVNNVSGPVKQ